MCYKCLISCLSLDKLGSLAYDEQGYLLSEAKKTYGDLQQQSYDSTLPHINRRSHQYLTIMADNHEYEELQ